MSRRIYILSLCLWLSVFISMHLFGQDVYTTVSVSPRNVYVGQPCKYTVKVYTDTWFTQGAVFQPFSLNDAFIVPANNQVGTERINGKTYSFVAHNYWVYPYNAGELLLPQQKIVVHSPAPAQYKATAKTIISKTANLNVTPNPPHISADNWIVAQRLNRTESWSGKTTNLKVGDVIERSVNINAYGTMASFMPELNWDKIDGISVYPQSPKITTETPERSTAIIANQKQTVAYLFEKEGTFTIPAVNIGYWDVNQHRWVDRSLPSLTVEVAPNDDLSVLASHRDSLMQQSQVEVLNHIPENQDDKWREWSIWTVYIIVGGVVILLLIYLIRRIKAQIVRYKKTEKYIFRKLLRSDSDKGFYAYLYRWISCVSDQNSLENLVKTKASLQLQADFNSYYKLMFEKSTNTKKRNTFLRTLRRELLRKDDRDNMELNP